ncbi:MAG: type VI secretion system baseplate subunit TssF [Nitrospirae bacterium]|nr:type VI secretion system baseplate subunit TssF [Nitrospirota bacterium]
MATRLEREYESELAFIRQYAKEFAAERPGIAGRLVLSEDTGVSQDPHVERMIEAFAFLTARVQVKLKDEFPELVDALLNILYPHYLAPIPSMAIAQLELDPAQGNLTTGPVIKRGTEIFSREINGLPCRFRTTADAELWPLEIVRARYESAPFGREISDVVDPRRLRDAESAIRIEIKSRSAHPLAKLDIKKLRFFLSGDNPTTNQLYELIFNHAVSVMIRIPEVNPKDSYAFLPASCLQQVGYGPEEGMLPYGPRSLPGYRLLTEFFTFPQKFLFCDITQLEILRQLRASCTPIVNLFKQSAEPIRLTRTRMQYPLYPDLRRQSAMEVYSIDEVESIHPETKEVIQYKPFFSFQHDSEAAGERAYWCHHRVPSIRDDDHGTDVYMSFVDLDFNPTVPPAEVALITTTCTNRDIPANVQKSGADPWAFQLVGQSPVRRITTPVEPTKPLRLREAANRWRLISHLSLNHLSITGGSDGAAALREILRLYDYTGSQTTAQMIEGITSINSERSVAPIQDAKTRGFCRGLDVAITFDDEKYPGTGFYLLASVLEHFLGQYATINSFTRMIAKSKQRDSWERKWAPRTGHLTLS